jgi:hypothetical protein
MTRPRGTVFIKFSNTIVSLEWGDYASGSLVSLLTTSMSHVKPALVDNIFRINRDNSTNEFIIFNNTRLVLITKDEGVALYAIIKNIMGVILSSTHNSVLIHSGLVSKNNRGVLLVGQSGAGKTTLTSLLCSKGWAYHSDEMVSINGDNTVWEGFSRPLFFKPGWENIHPHLVGSTCFTIFNNHITVIPTASIMNGVSAENEVTPGAIVFINYRAGCLPRLEMINKAPAALKLSTSVMNVDCLSKHFLRVVSDISRSVPSYMLTYSSFMDLDSIDSLLS